MPILEFTSPPLPHYLASGFCVIAPGRKHPNRHNIGVFDLLVVQEGCIYIMEGGVYYEVTAGHAIILRPDRHHYSPRGCTTDTAHYWLHFNTTGAWRETEEEAPQLPSVSMEEKSFTMQTFAIQLPQFTKLLKPTSVYRTMQQLGELEKESHRNWARWKHQQLFQQVLEQLNASLQAETPPPGAEVADQAASYLRQHFKQPVTAQSLGEALNFHPVYIARCMQREFGCSPFEYLLRYRLEQAKLLLLQTDFPVARVAEEVGFNQAAYFTSCFVKVEGLTPRAYRKRFSHA
ncbi:helix-turn-helix transcriptional regulator [Paenibacillus oleatilyticus]|uniref:Helix-turn-helix transcriptional regulator n=1 Tax=Paenibacillus oleatilyticus TaxID=2594886 RepID=A0ABV4UZM9_9BACL